MLIGITGGIGAGKSVVSRILRLKGYPVYDCDLRARILMENSEEIRQALMSRFGEEVISDDGTLDRALIATRVFANVEERDWLNKLVHGAVRDDLSKWTDEHGGAVCFVESAIMVTSGLDRMCDAIWLVDAPQEVRMARAIGRGGVDPENIALRMEAQRGEFDGLPPNKTIIIENTDQRSLLEQTDVRLEVIGIR